MEDGDQVDEELIEALGASQRLGFLGDRDVEAVIEHARAFVDAVRDVRGRVLDLGSGGGVPGLVLAWDRTDLQVTLVDRRTKRTDFLSRIVHRLELSSRVTVIAADVEDAIRLGHVGFDAVTARGFGPPEYTLRTALRCSAETAVVVISEPPARDRWNPALLRELGVVRSNDDSRVAVFRRLVVD